uniref:Ig-like domain-containing protein n=1 Tax=Cynoglossus semilaevis TaxID=244447 RepID=A0A3P8W6F3_CYNSE
RSGRINKKKTLFFYLYLKTLLRKCWVFFLTSVILLTRSKFIVVKRTETLQIHCSYNHLTGTVMQLMWFQQKEDGRLTWVGQVDSTGRKELNPEFSENVKITTEVTGNTTLIIYTPSSSAVYYCAARTQ